MPAKPIRARLASSWLINSRFKVQPPDLTSVSLAPQPTPNPQGGITAELPQAVLQDVPENGITSCSAGCPRIPGLDHARPKESWQWKPAEEPDGSA